MSLYAGPGKVFISNTGLFPEGENGQIAVSIDQEADDVSTAMHGRVTATRGDVTAKISFTPFDSWSTLGVLYPAYVRTPVIGTRAHGVVDVPAKIWTPDGRLYTFPRAAVTKHPEMHLGTGKALFGGMEITAIGATGKVHGADGFLVTVTENGGADPGGLMTLDDFVRGPWVGDFNELGVTIEAEEEWVITFDVKYSPLKVQKLTRAMKLDSVAIMAKCRPVGPTHTNLLAELGFQSGASGGERYGQDGFDLVLTGPGAKTITLKSADMVGAGFEFGGTKLGTGEVGFITSASFAAGAIQPLIVFSA